MSESNAVEHVGLLGKTAKDKVTGFSGVVSSVSFDLYGCVQVVLSPPIDKEGKLVEGRWFDINRIDIVNEQRVMPLPTFPRTAQAVHGPAEKPAR